MRRVNVDPLLNPWRVIAVEEWAEIRRLHRAEGVPIKEIVRRLGIARNTVRAALVSADPPKYERAVKGSLVDAVEPRVRVLLREFPRMPATVVAERIGWEHSITILKDRIRDIRPEYAGVDPADRLVHEPGIATQCDLWFPETRIPVGAAEPVMLPVLVMTLTHSRFHSAVMLPSRQGGDLLAGMWQVIGALGAVTKTLVWDREAAIGGNGRVTSLATAFAGTLATRFVLAPPRDPEFKGMVERLSRLERVRRTSEVRQDPTRETVSRRRARHRGDGSHEEEQPLPVPPKPVPARDEQARQTPRDRCGRAHPPRRDLAHARRRRSLARTRPRTPQHPRDREPDDPTAPLTRLRRHHHTHHNRSSSMTSR